MSEKPDSEDQPDVAADGVLAQLTQALEVQRRTLISTCLVCTGLVTGFIGFGLQLLGAGSTPRPGITGMSLAVFVLVLTPLAVRALDDSSRRTVTGALRAWGLTVVVVVVGGGRIMITDRNLAVLHLIGAVLLVFLGLWQLPERPQQAENAAG